MGIRELKCLALMFFVLAAAAPSAVLANPNTGSLRGVIRDVATNEPVRFKYGFVALTSYSGEFRTRPDRFGSYIIFAISPGRWVLTVETPGFNPIKKVVCIRAGQDRTLDILLNRALIDVVRILKTAPANSLEIQPDETSDLYSLGACD